MNNLREYLVSWVIQELDLPAEDTEVLATVRNVVDAAVDEFEKRYVDYLLYGEVSNNVQNHLSEREGPASGESV